MQDTFPLWLSILLLIITRIQQIYIRGLLQTKNPSAFLQLGHYLSFRLSSRPLSHSQFPHKRPSHFFRFTWSPRHQSCSCNSASKHFWSSKLMIHLTSHIPIGTSSSWSFSTLYVPWFLPFLLSSSIAFLYFQLPRATIKDGTSLFLLFLVFLSYFPSERSLGFRDFTPSLLECVCSELTVFKSTSKQLKNPIYALIGATIFAELLTTGTLN